RPSQRRRSSTRSACATTGASRRTASVPTASATARRIRSARSGAWGQRPTRASARRSGGFAPRSPTSVLRLPRFRFVRAATYAEAARLLREDPKAMLVAGGTDVYPNMKRRQYAPETLVSLDRVQG
ncbi:MAG: hypothetical protein E6I40_13205, partial [Chloroflexi bacterium]